jgi:hypothetical protein
MPSSSILATEPKKPLFLGSTTRALGEALVVALAGAASKPNDAAYGVVGPPCCCCWVGAEPKRWLKFHQDGIEHDVSGIQVGPVVWDTHLKSSLVLEAGIGGAGRCDPPLAVVVPADEDELEIPGKQFEHCAALYMLPHDIQRGIVRCGV